jgi:hypothetical protein
LRDLHDSQNSGGIKCNGKLFVRNWLKCNR